MSRALFTSGAALGFLLSGCPTEDARIPERDAAVDVASVGQPDPNDPLFACASMGGAPLQTIEEVTERLNAMPAPASLECFVASLPRPLRVVATNSIFSAQPAGGPESPRIFLLTEGLVISVVPSGRAAHLLELSEWVSAQSTLKAELAFPLERPLSATAPFERPDIGPPVTTCGFCHRDERPHESIEGGFVSLAFRPQPGTEVALEQLRALRDRCDEPSSSEAPQCGMLRALFDYGPVEQGAFPDGLAQFVYEGGG